MELGADSRFFLWYSTQTYFRLTTSTKSCINPDIKSQEIQGISLAIFSQDREHLLKCFLFVKLVCLNLTQEHTM